MVGLKVFPPSVIRHAYYDGILCDIIPCHTKRCPKDACAIQVIKLTLLYDGSERLSRLLYQLYYNSLASVTYFTDAISVGNSASILVPSLQMILMAEIMIGSHYIFFLIIIGIFTQTLSVLATVFP